MIEHLIRIWVVGVLAISAIFAVLWLVVTIRDRQLRRRDRAVPEYHGASVNYPVPAESAPDHSLIDSLDKLLFYTFIKCSVDNDLSGLIISGNPSKEQLEACWMGLFSRYCSLIGDKEADKYVKNTAKIEAVNTKIFQIECLVESVKKLKTIDLGVNIEAHLQRLASNLREWGYDKAFLTGTVEKDLKSVLRELGNDKLKLQIAIKSYQDEQKKKRKSGDKPTRQTYLRLLHAIEEHKKMVFDRNTLNMEDFAMYQKELHDHNQQLTAKSYKNGSR